MNNEMIDDILGTAFDSGISYWAGGAEPSKYPAGEDIWASQTLTRGATITITLAECPPSEVTLTLPAFKKGIRRAADHMGESVDHFLEDHDATGADIAVQFALFDEIVYG